MGFDCNNLYADLQDGVILCKVIDKIQPGIVDWKKVSLEPKNKFVKIGNTKHVIDCCKKLGISTVNVSGEDILAGNKKLILGIVWQLMRENILVMLKNLGGGKKVDEKTILEWANSKVGSPTISGFKDPSLATGVYLNKLCHAVSPNSVNMEFVNAGNTGKNSLNNLLIQ